MNAQVEVMASIRDQSVKVAADVVRMARTLVSLEGGAVGKLISDTCRSIFKKALEHAVKTGKIIPDPPPKDDD